MNAKSLLALWLSGFWLLCTASADVTFQPVALTGQRAPGLSNNITFSEFTSFLLADDGRIAFTGNVSGPGVSATNSQGLWAGLSSDLRLLARAGDLTPGDTTNQDVFQAFGPPNIDNHQVVGFLALTKRPDEPNAPGGKPDVFWGDDVFRARSTILV